MLKSIDPALSADLLYVLAAMGHGDTIAIVDANFPAASVAADTVYGEAIGSDCDLPRLLAAVLSVLPLNTFEPDPAIGMQVVDDPGAVPEVVAAMAAEVAAAGAAWASVGRFEFYAAARTAFALVRTGERRFYGNVILRKGVLPPD